MSSNDQIQLMKLSSKLGALLRKAPSCRPVEQGVLEIHIHTIRKAISVLCNEAKRKDWRIL